MTVELIEQPSSNGPLDLTEAGDKEVLDLTTSSAEEEPQEDHSTEDEDESLDLTDDKPEDPAEPEETPETEESEEEAEGPEYFFGEDRVSVEVPDEIQDALKEAGIDQDSLLSQLFKKDGDFSLDEETTKQLEDKFGKTLVAGYLNMYKGINENQKQTLAAAKESEEAQQTARNTEYSEAVGGEEGLVAMESYIEGNLSDSNIEAYNAVMDSDNHAAQMLVISQIKAQMELADKLANGDKPSALIGDKEASSSTTGSPLEKGYISDSEYQGIMESERYWDDRDYQQRVDAARSAGIRKQV